MVQRAEEFFERLAPLAVVTLVVLFAAWAWFASRGTRLQFDELLEISAANAPTLGGVVAALASGVDFNPPLSHFLVRASLSALGNADWVVRLPAFLGMVLLLVSLYLFVARQVGRIYGVVAMLVIICLPIRVYAIQARPYGLVLGFSALSLLCYRAATRPQWRAFALAGLAVCTAAMVGSHYYATLVVGVLVAASLVRALLARKLDWPLLLSCAVPPLTVLVLLRDVVTQQRHQLTHYFARGSLISFDHGYDDFVMDPLVYCVAILLGIAILAIAVRGGIGSVAAESIRDIQPDTMALALGLLSLPLVGAVVTQFVTHAYLTRYFVPAAIGLAICACYALRFVAGAVPGLVLISLLSLGMGFGKAILQEAHRAPEAIPSTAELAANSTPILFDTPEAYMQVYHYRPELRKNTWAITDPAAALRYRQYDTDDRIMLAVAAMHVAQTVSLSDAVRTWPSFRLVPRSADYVWALKCLMEGGAQIGVSRPFGASNFIFDVNVHPKTLCRIDACAR